AITVLSSDENGQVIPGKYIVVLKKSVINGSRMSSALSYDERNAVVKNEAKAILGSYDISENAIERTYNTALTGFSVSLSEEQVEILKQDPKVDFIEQDKIVALGKPGGGPAPQPAQVIPYGIARVGTGDGTGKIAWIIDTGVDLDHADLNVNVSRSKSFLTSGSNFSSPDDFNGHGTHVAGIVAAKNNTIGVVGVAANATLISVRVLNAKGSGTTSGVINGVDYVAANGSAGNVANLSLGGGISVALDNAVVAAAGTGIFFSVAAGNESDDANNHSPSRANGPNVFTVSAMDNLDNWASFSNYGSSVDFCAPGVNIKSTWKGGTYSTISGTSMAAPHVAGVLLMTGGVPIVSGYVKGDPDGNADPIAHL
ncbi:MAG: S8 family peptidase, partial [Bacteroidales bacterium]|nr:S8 family peptidase [Bacteroidales bacterium]